jgi:hypothetical protein
MEIFRILAIIKQLGNMGTASSIVAVSYCNLHEYIIDLAGVSWFHGTNITESLSESVCIVLHCHAD